MEPLRVPQGAPPDPVSDDYQARWHGTDAAIVIDHGTAHGSEPHDLQRDGRGQEKSEGGCSMRGVV